MPFHSHSVSLAKLVGGGSPICPLNSPCLSKSSELYIPSLKVPAPTLISSSAGDAHQGAILYAGTPTVADAKPPAVPGEVVELYVTGLIDSAVWPPRVSIGGILAQFIYSGSAPGFPGLNQINVRIPKNVTLGTAIPVRMNYFDRPSNEVIIAIQLQNSRVPLCLVANGLVER